jgi:hypothetical protein
MTGYTLFWIIVIVFSITSFTYMSVKMLYRGIPELLEMFRRLRETKSKRMKNE